jgi:hypothetical protein
MLRKLSLYLLLFSFLFSGNAIGQKPETMYFPVPVRVDRQEVLTSLYLKADFTDYHQSLSQFEKSNATGDNGEKVLVEILKAVLANDLESYKPYSKRSAEQAKDELELYRYLNRVEKGKEPEILFRFDVGNLKIYYVNMNHHKSPFLAFGLLKTESGYLNALPELNHPVCESVSAIARGMTKKENALKPQKEVSKSTLVNVKNVFGSTMTFAFVGEKVWVNTTNLNDTANFYAEKYDDLITFFTQTIIHLRKVEKEPFLKALGPFSKAKFQKLFEANTDEEMGELANFLTRNMYVSYIIDADPVYFIAYFQFKKPSDKISPAFMCVKKEKGSFQLSNMYMVSYINKLLQMSAFVQAVRQ